MSTESQEKSASWRLLGERTRRQLEELDALLERMLALPPFDLPEEQSSDPPSSSIPGSSQKLAATGTPGNSESSTSNSGSVQNHPQTPTSTVSPEKPSAASVSAAPQAGSANNTKIAATEPAETSSIARSKPPAEALAQSVSISAAASPGGTTPASEPPAVSESALAKAKPAPSADAGMKPRNETTNSAEQAPAVTISASAKRIASRPVPDEESVERVAEPGTVVSRTATPRETKTASATQSAASGARPVNNPTLAGPKLPESSTVTPAERHDSAAPAIRSAADDSESRASASVPTEPPLQASSEPPKGPAWLLREDTGPGDADADRSVADTSKDASGSNNGATSLDESQSGFRWIRPITENLAQPLRWLFLTPTGSNVLGWIGILLLLGSAAFWLGAWLGWHW
jgi:hypothetical protein